MFVEIRTVRELWGHSDVHTIMDFTHVLNCGGRGVRSPADLLRQGPPLPSAISNPSNAPPDG